MADPIKKLTIEGFKSIRKLEDFQLRALNVLIGANGAGKSNFVGFFRLLGEMIEQRLQVALATTEGGRMRAFSWVRKSLTSSPQNFTSARTDTNSLSLPRPIIGLSFRTSRPDFLGILAILVGRWALGISRPN
jgi:hypothetical protein